MSFDGDLYPTSGATSVLSTKGDLVRYDSERERYGIGSAGQVLQVASSLPTWSTINLADSVLTTQGDVLYEGASALARLGQSTNNFTLATKGLGQNPAWQASATSVLGTTGDILSCSSANVLSAISPTTSGHVLTSNGATTLPSFQAVSAGGWTHLTTKTLSSDGTLETDTFTAKNYLHIVAFAARASSDTQGWQFNNDTGSNYDNNRSYNYGSSTIRDDKGCISTDGINTDDYFHATFMDFINLTAYNKYGFCTDQRQSTGTDGSMDVQLTSACWQNTDEQITKITATEGGTGAGIDYKENSFIIVFGRD